MRQASNKATGRVLFPLGGCVMFVKVLLVTQGVSRVCCTRPVTEALLPVSPRPIEN